MSLIRFHGDLKVLIGISVGISLANDSDLYVKEDPVESADGPHHILVVEDAGQGENPPFDYWVTGEGEYTRFDPEYQ